MKLTQEQYESALKLARAFGHEWAGAAESSGLFVGSGDKFAPTTELIDALVDAHHAANPRFEPWQAGISCPETDGSDVVHTTGTGRLRWLVNGNGKVTIYVNRPQQDLILRVFVKPAEPVVKPQLSGWHRPSLATDQWAHWEAGGVSIWTEYLDLVRRRHVEVAIEAVAALVGEEGARLAFSELLDLFSEEAEAEQTPTPAPDLAGEPPVEEIPEYTLADIAPPAPQWE